MIYFLDFDRTLFDTDSFVAYLKSRAENSHIFEQDEDIAGALTAAVQSGTLSFAPGELAPFLYPDASQFLRDKENAAMVITYGDPAFQKAKIQSAIAGIPRISVMYTGMVRKGEFLAPHIGNYGPSLLVDDQPDELELLSNTCKSLDLYEMRRDGKDGSGPWNTVRSLAELP